MVWDHQETILVDIITKGINEAFISLTLRMSDIERMLDNISNSEPFVDILSDSSAADVVPNLTITHSYNEIHIGADMDWSDYIASFDFEMDKNLFYEIMKDAFVYIMERTDFQTSKKYYL